MKKSNLKFVNLFRNLLKKEIDLIYKTTSNGDMNIVKGAFYFDIFIRYPHGFSDDEDEFLILTEEYRDLCYKKLGMSDQDFLDRFCATDSYSSLFLVENVEKKKDYFEISAYDVLRAKSLKIYSDESPTGMNVAYPSSNILRILMLDNEYYLLDFYLSIPKFNFKKFEVFSDEIIAEVRTADYFAKLSPGVYSNSSVIINGYYLDIFKNVIAASQDPIANVLQGFFDEHREYFEVVKKSLDMEEVSFEYYASFVKAISLFLDTKKDFNELPEFLKSVISDGLILNTDAVPTFVRFVENFLKEIKADEKIIKSLRENLFVYKSLIANTKLGITYNKDIFDIIDNSEIEADYLVDLVFAISWEISSNSFKPKKNTLELTETKARKIKESFALSFYESPKKDILDLSYKFAYDTLIKRGFIVKTDDGVLDITETLNLLETMTSDEVNAILIENLFDREYLKELIGRNRANSLLNGLEELRNGKFILKDGEEALLRGLGILIDGKKALGFDELYDKFSGVADRKNIIDIDFKEKEDK